MGNPYYDLASGAAEMNQSLSGSTVSSIIAIAVNSADGIEASYKIKRGKPQFSSYAKEVLSVKKPEFSNYINKWRITMNIETRILSSLKRYFLLRRPRRPPPPFPV